MMNRLNQFPTLKIDPAEKILFQYKGKQYSGLKGDTIASALFANGVRIFGRSLKYHRPRGLYSLDGECSNTCMDVNGIPNTRCENTLLKSNMIIKDQNVKGSANHDIMGFMDKLDFLMPAGFYYKTMHKPAKIWPIAMKQIRKAAGSGIINPDFRIQGTYDEIFPTADVCVIGGGPAGMNAALAAAEKGLRVILMESRPWPGGFFDYRTAEYKDGKPLYKRAKELGAKISSTDNIRVFLHTFMVGAYNNNLITGFQVGKNSDSFDERYIEIRAQSVVVATGCIERPLLFDNNELPGIMQIGCAHRLARTYGILAGEKAVFSIGHDLGLEAAIDLFDMGLKIACVADIREDGQNPDLISSLEKRNIKFLRGWVAAKAHGSKKVKSVILACLSALVTEKIECDLLVASAGMTPVTGPLTIVQGTLQYDNYTGFFLPDKVPDKMHMAGRIMGLDDSFAIETSGRLAGLNAAFDCCVRHNFDNKEYGKTSHHPGKHCHHNDKSPNIPSVPSEHFNHHDKSGYDEIRPDNCKARLNPYAIIKEINELKIKLKKLPGVTRGTKLVTAPVKGRKTFICFDEDTTIKNIKQAIQMGFNVPELIKRFTSAGTGPGQGGIPGHNLPLFVSQYQQAKSEKSGLKLRPTNVRSPLVPPLLATFAGTNHNMRKKTPVDDLQRKDGGIFRRIGAWERARYFSNDFSCKKEIENVRTNVGLFDGSTLGKFRLHGPDALNALQRIYVSDMSKLKPGRVKYSAMCNDDGCVIDDGVVVKINENDYYFTTSTGRAGATVEWFRYHTRYDGWDFNLVNLTDAMGVINLAGPNARRVFEKIIDIDEDISNENFPYSGYREFLIKRTIPVKVMRLGFVGELSYEFHVPSSYMKALWLILSKAGKEFNIKNFGVEAQNVLRMEKCHVILGSESEQRTNLLDIGLGFLWDRTKTYARTIGAVALRQAENDPERLKLIGFKMENNAHAPEEGSLIVDEKIRGYVCTTRYSTTLNEAVGMALVDSELSKTGTILEFYEVECGDKRIHGKVVPVPFYDPDGKRMKM